MRTCRNCELPLNPKDKNLVCFKCQCAYLDFSFIKPYFREVDFDKFQKDSKNFISKSKHHCPVCKKQMSLHFIGKNIQVESCSPCQKVWFEYSEIGKFQNYMQLKNDGKFITFEEGRSSMTFTEYLFHKSLDLNVLVKPAMYELGKLGQAEMLTNYVGNRVTDTKFFKKYPVLTFLLVVALFVLICKI